MLKELYRRRFIKDMDFRKEMWHVLYHNFFKKYIPDNSAIIDIGAGYCEFINYVDSNKKHVYDANTDISIYANPDIKIIRDLSTIQSETMDIVFMSNFLEHLTKSEIVHTITESSRILSPNGKLLILYPNIRYCYKDFWMFLDHITPLDDRSMVELLEINGFKINENIIRFLPYTTKSNLPHSISLLKLYLRLPLLWKLTGQQSFICAEK